MMKKLTALILAALLVLTAAGCSQKEPPKNHFVDTWYEAGDMGSFRMEIWKDCSWSIYDPADGAIVCSGTGKLKDEQHMTMLTGGEETAEAVLQKDGSLRVSDIGTKQWYFSNPLFLLRKAESTKPTQPPTQPPTEAPQPSFDQFVGLWKYDYYDQWLEILDDGTWYVLDADSQILDEGILTALEGSIQLDTGDGIFQLMTTGDNTMTDNVGTTFTAVEEIEETPFFDSYGIYPNIQAGEGMVYLENGCEYVVEDGSFYMTGSVYWEVEYLKDSYTQDGLRDVTVLAMCHFSDPPDEVQLIGRHLYGCASELYDRYTGRSFAMYGNTVGDIESESNSFSRTVEVGGQTYEVRYNTQIRWEKDVADGERIMYKTINLQFPEEYDGILLCLMPAYDNFAEYDTYHGKVRDYIIDADIERASKGLVFAID